MSYAGLEEELKPRCRPDAHVWIPRGDCHICGVYKKDLIEEARKVLDIYEK